MTVSLELAVNPPRYHIPMWTAKSGLLYMVPRSCSLGLGSMSEAEIFFEKSRSEEVPDGSN